MIVIFAKGLLMTVHQKNVIKGFVLFLALLKKKKEKRKEKKNKQKKCQFAVNQLSN